MDLPRFAFVSPTSRFFSFLDISTQLVVASAPGYEFNPAIRIAQAVHFIRCSSGIRIMRPPFCMVIVSDLDSSLGPKKVGQVCIEKVESVVATLDLALRYKRARLAWSISVGRLPGRSCLSPAPDK